MLPWSEVIDPVADQNGFAGVVSVHRGGETELPGHVVLALIVERVSGVAFDQLVADRVCGPAGMADTAFPRSDTAFLRADELPHWATCP